MTQEIMPRVGGSTAGSAPVSCPPWQMAAAFAARAHAHQVRKDRRTPYVSHCFRVAMTVRDVFDCNDPVALTAALLHDTIEDTSTDYDDLASAFGETVAACVAALTKNMALPEQRRESDYDARLAAADWRARLIKLADAYDNLCDFATRATENPDARERTAHRARRALALAAPDRGQHPAVDRACRTVEAMLASFVPM